MFLQYYNYFTNIGNILPHIPNILPSLLIFPNIPYLLYSPNLIHFLQMSEEDSTSLEALRQMCEKTNNNVHTAPAPKSSTESSEVPDPDPAMVFDLNDILFLALQLEEQLKFNKVELPE